MGDAHTWVAIAVIALVTAAIRFLPFLIFGKKGRTPRIVEHLGRVLPAAVIGMLVVYCLKDVYFTELVGFLPTLIACAVVVGVHLWRRNTLLSILLGTVSYMLLVQLVFI